MPIQKIPVTGLDDINHRRRAREVLNQVLDHSFDDSRRRTDAEVAAGITPVNPAFPPGDVRRYGAKGDGVADDLAALNTAFSLVDYVITMPDGTYRISANLDVVTCQAIIGSGVDSCVIKPDSGVTKVMSLGDAEAPRVLKNFKIDGTSTTGAIGMVVGDASAWAGILEQIRIENFTGTNARGIKFADALKTTIDNCTFQSNTVGCLLQPTNPVFPTTLTFISCVFNNNSEQGLLATEGNGCNFIGCDFESNTKEGVLLLPASGDIIRAFNFIGCWFEDNWVGNGSRTSQFQFVAGDGTALGGAKIQARLTSCYIATDGTTPKAILFDGSAASGVIYDPRVINQVTGAIAFRNSAYGLIDATPAEYDYPDLLEDNSNTVGNTPGLWKTHAGTYASSVGNAAASFTGAITTNVSRFKKLGKTAIVNFDFEGTLQAITPTTITVTLPTGVTPSYNHYAGTQINIGGTYYAATIAAITDGKIHFGKADNSAFASGATFTMRGTITFEIV